MGITSLRRHLYKEHYANLAPTRAPLEGGMHSSGLTMKEYNEIVAEVAKMTDEDIIETVSDINKATTIAVLEPVEVASAQEENKEKEENVEALTGVISQDDFQDLTDGYTSKKKRTSRKKVI